MTDPADPGGLTPVDPPSLDPNQLPDHSGDTAPPGPWKQENLTPQPEPDSPADPTDDDATDDMPE